MARPFSERLQAQYTQAEQLMRQMDAFDGSPGREPVTHLTTAICALEAGLEELNLPDGSNSGFDALVMLHDTSTQQSHDDRSHHCPPTAGPANDK